jgi:hypothetical protein
MADLFSLTPAGHYRFQKRGLGSIGQFRTATQKGKRLIEGLRASVLAPFRQPIRVMRQRGQWQDTCV